jgi:hypothetical protein
LFGTREESAPAGESVVKTTDEALLIVDFWTFDEQVTIFD